MSMDVKTIKHILKTEGLVAFARLYVDGLLSTKSFIKIVKIFEKSA